MGMMPSLKTTLSEAQVEIIIQACTHGCDGCGGLGQAEYCKEVGNALWNEMQTCVICHGKKTVFDEIEFKRVIRIVEKVVAVKDD